MAVPVATIENRTLRINEWSQLPLIAAIKTWLEAELNRVRPRGGVADAIRYALTRWSALCRFLDDGRIELDNNTVERAIRPSPLAARTICLPDPMCAAARRPAGRPGM